ncbi:MAG: hypothetical protein ACXU88_15520, partial [Myxococcaceae bacterium]
MGPEELRKQLVVLVQTQPNHGMPESQRALVRMREGELRVGSSAPFFVWKAVWEEMERHTDELLRNLLEPELKNYSDPDEFGRLATEVVQPMLLGHFEAWSVEMVQIVTSESASVMDRYLDGHLQSGKQTGFTDEDHIWAEAL